MKFEIQALFGVLFDICRELEGTSMIYTRPMVSKLYSYYSIRLGLKYEFFPDFFLLWAPSALVEHVFKCLLIGKKIEKRFSIFWVSG